ncbi:radical SAM protein [Streptomyces nanhaiensis]|uniref:radical SAM protein n=1 Tax=Streptomyces nanhaiensis TaxID=679319 RepID=UPI00399D42D4
MPDRNVDLLWALRSPCNLGCTYCYFGTIEEHRDRPALEVGRLSHLSRTDLGLPEIAAFVATLADSPVRRIFLAGGEPLIWPPVLEIVEEIKRGGVEVVLCTNGIPLGRDAVARRIVELGVDAVSVSLDADTAAVNDRYRPARNRKDGFDQVLAGVENLLRRRAEAGGQGPRIGLYAAIGRHNITAINTVPRLAAGLGLDYFVPQPVSLAPDHALHDELCLRPDDIERVRAELDRLWRSRPVDLPDASYPDRFVAAVTPGAPSRVAACFGGTFLHFIQPDGSVWDCPSALRIAATEPDRRRSIADRTAAELFAHDGACGGCALFSADCVSMWPLTGFGSFLPGGVR